MKKNSYIFESINHYLFFWLKKKHIKKYFWRHGLENTVEYIQKSNLSNLDKTASFCHLIKREHKSNKHSPQIRSLAKLVENSDMSNPVVRRLIAPRLSNILDAGAARTAGRLMAQLPANFPLPRALSRKKTKLFNIVRFLDGNIYIPPRKNTPDYQCIDKTILYVAASSFPYHTTGYTVRTHGVVRALINSGWKVKCVTRPGYPMDRSDRKCEPLADGYHADNVHYEILNIKHTTKDIDFEQSLALTFASIEEKARKEKVSAIHAASNYANALPALIAARNLGIPFIYEVRGLWEYSKASRYTNWELSDEFLAEAKMEALVAKEADRVLTLTNALSSELIVRGVEANKISVVPNAVDVDLYVPQQPDNELAASLNLPERCFTIGYIGSIVAYEGLDNLVDAFVTVHKALPHSRLIIVGDGHSLTSLKKQVADLALENAVIFTGKVPSDQVHRYYSLMNIMVLPRKPFKVCHLVSPLKPIEIMAMGVPLIVSDVDAMKEMVLDGKLALLHKAGDVESISQTILEAASNQSAMRERSLFAKSYVTENQTWEKIISCITHIYEDLYSH